MLTPRHWEHVILLPQDYTIMDMLSISKEDYLEFRKELQRHRQVQPSEIVAFDPFTIGLALIGVGLILGVVASFIQRQNNEAPPRINSNTVDGQDIVRSGRFTAKTGFDSTQNVVELNSIVPLIYAKREVIDGIPYGGVRVNTNTLWSQILSVGGSQVLKALYLLGEGGLGPINPNQIAIGNNILSTYELAPEGSLGSRASLYYKPNGGRIVSGDFIGGRPAAQDAANAQNNGGPDVYSVRGFNNAWTQNFSYALFPSNQTEFGLYAPIGNGVPVRINPVIRPARRPGLIPRGDEGDARVLCDTDLAAAVQRQKQNVFFSSRCAINGSAYGDVFVNPGNTATLQLLADTDALVEWTQVSEDTSDEINGGPYTEKSFEPAQTIAGRLRAYDDNLIVGETYKIGTALAVLTSRTELPYISNVDNEPVGGGRSISATFTFITSGQYQTQPLALAPTSNSINAVTGTRTSHIFRIALGGFVVDRPVQNLEIGIESQVGLTISGICNYKEARSYFYADFEACGRYDLSTIPRGKTLNNTIYNSGTYSGPYERYSCFRIGYRLGGSNDPFVFLDRPFAVRSQTNASLFNYIRLQMPGAERWEFRFFPISGWEVRFQIYGPSLYVLDYKGSEQLRFLSNGIRVYWGGEEVFINQNTFKLEPVHALIEPSLGMPAVEGNAYDDPWGKLSELFLHEQINPNIDQPEHRIKYVNINMPNAETPQYTNLAILGMNVRSSRELRTVDQVSVYIDQGLANTHLIGSILRDIYENSRYGAGSITPPALIDTASFNAADTWTFNRRYFFDGAITAKSNFPEWAGQLAQRFLHDLIRKNGRYYLEPAVRFNQPVTITGIYTSDNIIPGSFSVNKKDVEQRILPVVTVKWREERLSGNLSNRGLFPVLREVRVREVGTPEDAPLISIDVSDWCTSEAQAVDIAKFECRKIRYNTDIITFEVIPEAAALELGQCFKVPIDEISYDDGVVGAILPDSTLWPPLEDGTYEALLWSGGTVGTGTSSEVTFNVVNGVADAASGVYSFKRVVTESTTWKLANLDFTEFGNLRIVGISFPVNDSDIALMGLDWEDGFIVEGLTEDYSQPVLDIQAVWIGSVSSSTAPVFSTNAPNGLFVYSTTTSGSRGASNRPTWQFLQQ